MAVSVATTRIREPDVMDGGSSKLLRGDCMTGDQYWSREFMQREWDHMWTRVWHIGGRLAELREAGDYVVHNLRHESVLIVRQQDGSVRAFYNVCQHRGNRLVWNDGGTLAAFTCAYHGWRYALDGTLTFARDPENFAKGDPCRKTHLVEVPCESWGGFVWYCMDPKARPLAEFLDPIPRLLQNREMEKMTRVLWRKVKVNTNWKFASDNFNESYHLPYVHPSMGIYVVEDYVGHRFEIHANGHNRVVELGHPSARAIQSERWSDVLKAWGLDPAQYASKPAEARLALQKVKRTSGPARGHHYMQKLTDEELTDYFHHTLFPNVTITGSPDSGCVHIFRTEPDAEDPEKCTFEYMALFPQIEGVDTVATVAGMLPLEEAQVEELTYGVDPVGDFIDEDLSVAVQQQRGLHSRGYRDAILSEQEARVRRFHEVLNDYLEGRR
jgi:phenylpropionate dioxygenase-like ring-hydroxylating dioxygenase large terminal subunit